MQSICKVSCSYTSYLSLHPICVFFIWTYFILRYNRLGTTPVTCPVVQQLFQNIRRATHVITKPRPTKHVIGTSSIAVEKIRWITVECSVFAQLFNEIYFDDPLLRKQMFPVENLQDLTNTDIRNTLYPLVLS